MDKKEIYEHLAKIYLDSSAKKTKKLIPPQRYKNLLLISVSLAVILAFTAALRHFSPSHKNAQSELALLLLVEAAKINFTFDPAKKETYTINLNKLNLSKFKTLGFALKKTDYHDNISVRVEFTNAFQEKSALYVKNIPLRWQDYKIPLADFKDIGDWSEMAKLAFIVEEWNAQAKHGIMYIDNIKLLRQK